MAWNSSAGGNATRASAWARAVAAQVRYLPSKTGVATVVVVVEAPIAGVAAVAVPMTKKTRRGLETKLTSI